MQITGMQFIFFGNLPYFLHYSYEFEFLSV